MKNQYRYFAIAIVVAFLILPLAGVASDQSEPRSAPATRENDAGIEILRIPEEHPPDMAVEKGPYVAPVSEQSPIIPVPRDRPSEGAAPSDTGESDLQKRSEVAAIDGAIALPDLVITGYTTNKTMVRWDEPLASYIQVANIGTVNSGGFYVDFMLSLDNTITAADYRIGYLYFSNVAPGSHPNASCVISYFPRYVPPGTYYIGYWCDPDSIVIESDETNNIAVDSTRLTVAYPNKPDLLDDGAYWFYMNKSSYNPNEWFEVQSDVRNRGPVASGSFYVDYYLSTDTTITTSDYYIGYDYLFSVPAGGYGDSDYYGTIPGTIPAGTYYLGCIIDSLEAVPEFDETNNKAVDDSTYTIQGSITVTAPDGDQTWLPGSTQTITWTQAGLSGTDVRILLMKSAGYNIAQIITSPISATSGSYNWTVPTTLAGGTDYWVKIESLSYPEVYGDMWSGWITIPNPVPTITTISPASKNAGDPAFTLTVTGTNFNPSSKVRWNGADRTTTYTSATSLTAAIPASDIASTGTATVTVFNPTPGGGTSNGVTFTKNPPSNPVPTLSSISPTTKNAGDPGFTLTVTGTNFNPGSKVRWNGADRTTTYTSATSLTAAIPASDIVSAGTASVTVFNPTPGGGTSAAKTFTISGPTITVLAPNGGETYYLGGPLSMSWSYSGNPGSAVNIEVLRESTILKVIPGIPIGSGGSGSFSVTIPASTSYVGYYRIRVTSASNPAYSDTSNGPFTIDSPKITVTMPNGGENFPLGAPLPMSWTYNGNPGPTVTIEVLRSGAVLKVLSGIPTGAGGSGSYSVPMIPYSTPQGSDYTIRVTSPLYASCTDTSNGTFTISGPTITVKAPNGGETYHVGAPLPMSWTYTGDPGPTVTIEVLRSGAVLKVLPGIPTGAGGSGSYSVPMIPSGTPLASDYQIRVKSTAIGSCADTSNGYFTIAPI